MLHVFYAAITIISMLFAINLCFSSAILMKFLDSAEPQGLAEGLIGFFDGTLRLPNADDCSTFARQRFAWPVIAQRVADLYSTVLSQR